MCVELNNVDVPTESYIYLYIDCYKSFVVDIALHCLPSRW